MRFRGYVRKSTVLALVVLGGAILILGCSGETPTRTFNDEDLLVDLSVFPPGWYVDIPAESPVDRWGSVDGVEIQFRADNPVSIVAIHTIHRYRSERDASKWYDRLQSSWFNDNSILSLTPWTTPDQLPYQSLLANKSRFACHDSNVGGRATICQFMGQYGEYIVIFHTVMTPDDMQPQSYMTFTDLRRILEAIDERMAQHLKDGSR